MTSLAIDEIVNIGSRDVELTDELFSDQRGSAFLAQTPEEERVLVWTGTEEWRRSVERLLEAFRPGLAHVIEADEHEDEHVVLLEGPPMSAIPFDDDRWQELDHALAVHGLRSLAHSLGQLHAGNGWLHGLKRRELLFDPATGQIYIGAMPRLHADKYPSVEAPWRDMRLIGELAYENFLDDEYPGGHQMATILQDRVALGELGIVFPGLPQLLAGCVSPYGDLAYGTTNDLVAGLDQLELELVQPWSFHVGAASTVGNYIFRKNNQDSCGHIAVQSICGSSKVSLGFFCVADGIGGIQDGERASRLAVEAACEAFGRGWANYGADRLIEYPNDFAISVAKVVGQRLALEGEFEPENNRGGTTFSGLLIADRRAAVCHVGDTRIVLVRDGEVIALTHDHTLANILIELGELTPAEAEDHELSQRTISRFLSTSTEVELDRIDTFGPDAREAFGEEISRRGMLVQTGDIFVLTSDGAHGEVTAQQFAEMLAEYDDDPQALADVVVANALEQVGRDNSTILVVRVD